MILGHGFEKQWFGQGTNGETKEDQIWNEIWTGFSCHIDDTCQACCSTLLGASLVWISGGSGLVQSLIKETLPSCFLSENGSEQEGGGESGLVVAMLRGYALAYFAVLSGSTFAWGIDCVHQHCQHQNDDRPFLGLIWNLLLVPKMGKYHYVVIGLCGMHMCQGL